MPKPPHPIPKSAPSAPRILPAKSGVSVPAALAGSVSRLHECFAVIAPGLEELALAEAIALGLPATMARGGGGIEWQGNLNSVLRANLGLRIASRVVIRIAQFEATTFAELERQSRRIEWSRVVPPGSGVRFRVTCKKSRLYHSDAVAQRVADAIVRALPGTRVEGASEGTAAGEMEQTLDQLIIIRLFHDQCTLNAATSGDLLHRRGYRLATAKAPMRETIAAALLAASLWDGVAPLVDPLCGSGTIPIEAALMARRTVPGARSFAVERWPTLSHATAVRVLKELMTHALSRAPGVIIGSDRDAGAITSASANAKRAGVGDDVAFVERSISALALPEGPRGWVVANPPYGLRVGDGAGVRDLWGRLGSTLRARGRGWHVALSSPDARLERQLGFPMQVVATTTNGGIPIRLVVGEVR